MTENLNTVCILKRRYYLSMSQQGPRSIHILPAGLLTSRVVDSSKTLF